jgi:hypothetical protein
MKTLLEFLALCASYLSDFLDAAGALRAHPNGLRIHYNFMKRRDANLPARARRN